MIEITERVAVGSGQNVKGETIQIERGISRVALTELERADDGIVAAWLTTTITTFIAHVEETNKDANFEAVNAVFVESFAGPVTERSITFVGFWQASSFVIDLIDVDELDAYLVQQGLPFAE